VTCDFAGALQGLLEIAEDTGMGEALRAAGLDVDKLKQEAQEKLVSRSPVSAVTQLVDWDGLAPGLCKCQGAACCPK
jgi:hypothetical protein